LRATAIVAFFKPLRMATNIGEALRIAQAQD